MMGYTAFGAHQSHHASTFYTWKGGVFLSKPRAAFQFIVQKWPVPESDGASVPKKPDLVLQPDGHQGGRKSR